MNFRVSKTTKKKIKKMAAQIVLVIDHPKDLSHLKQVLLKEKAIENKENK